MEVGAGLLDRSAWSLRHIEEQSKMAQGLGPADEEARAEVEVLNSRLEKTRQLNKKIQASLTRLEANGKSMQDAIGPIYGNTQKLQILGTSMWHGAIKQNAEEQMLMSGQILKAS